MKRHPQIRSRSVEALSTAAAAVNSEDVRRWFDDVYESLKELDALDILEDPERIYNTDESACEPAKNKTAYGEKGKPVFELQDSKDSFTVLFTFSASGRVMKPYVVLKGKRATGDLKEEIQKKDFHYTFTENGWQTAASFSHWIDLFNQELTTLNIKKPVILYADGHSSHEDYEVK